MAETAPDINGGSVFEATKANAAAAFDSVTNGPVAQNVKEHTAKASSELSNLAASRKTPETRAATGQPLTHYHSFFNELLSWNNPRASAIALVSTVLAILAFRYVDVARHGLRLAWMALGITVTSEAIGKFLFNKGIATQLRPRRYYTVSRATIDSLVGDTHELINFVVIEAQRILFVESIPASIAAAILAFLSYHLTKIVPYWGLAIIGTVIAFVAPLIYVSNKEIIDEQLKNASEAIDAQTAQVRNVAQKQVHQVATAGKQYAGDYSHKVQELIRGRGSPSKTVAVPKQPEFPSPPTEEPTKVPEIHVPDVPDEPIGGVKKEESETAL